MNVAVVYGSIDLATATDLVSGWRLDGARLAQVIAGLRAANLKTRDRRNASHTLAFTVTRAPVATPKDAFVFLATHQRDIDAATAVVDVVITHTPGPVTVTLKDATLTRAAGRIVGVTTIFDYEITGGLIEIS